MQFLKGVRGLESPLESSALTIGSFDGVHRGHQELMTRLLKRARYHKIPAVALTFNPHPSRVLTPEKPVARLFDFQDQRERIELLGVDLLIEEEFTKEFSRLEARAFFEDYIWKPLHPKALVIGHDFSFGADRSGTREFVTKLCAEKGIELEIVTAVEVDGRPVSSSRIREALRSGDVETAQALLGRPYYIKGEVIHGHQRGRLIGVPTANIRPLMEFIPRQGVYISQTRVGSQQFQSITNLGINPTFTSDVHAPIRLETHLFDFAGDLYGREIRVELLKHVRDEMKFAGVPELQAQIAHDQEEARKFFRGRS